MVSGQRRRQDKNKEKKKVAKRAALDARADVPSDDGRRRNDGARGRSRSPGGGGGGGGGARRRSRSREGGRQRGRSRSRDRYEARGGVRGGARGYCGGYGDRCDDERGGGYRDGGGGGGGYGERRDDGRGYRDGGGRGGYPDDGRGGGGGRDGRDEEECTTWAQRDSRRGQDDGMRGAEDEGGTRSRSASLPPGVQQPRFDPDELGGLESKRGSCRQSPAVAGAPRVSWGAFVETSMLRGTSRLRGSCLQYPAVTAAAAAPDDEGKSAASSEPRDFFANKLMSISMDMAAEELAADEYAEGKQAKEEKDDAARGGGAGGAERQVLDEVREAALLLRLAEKKEAKKKQVRGHVLVLSKTRRAELTRRVKSWHAIAKRQQQAAWLLQQQTGSNMAPAAAPLHFEASLTAGERKFVHVMCNWRGSELSSKSEGTGAARHVVVHASAGGGAMDFVEDGEAVLKLNVGGQVFDIAAKHLMKDRFSLLASVCTRSRAIRPDAGGGGGGGAFFFDRDGLIFRHIYQFLLDGTLPQSMATLRELHYEAAFYRLALLRYAVETRFNEWGKSAASAREEGGQQCAETAVSGGSTCAAIGGSDCAEAAEAEIALWCAAIPSESFEELVANEDRCTAWGQDDGMRSAEDESGTCLRSVSPTPGVHQPMFHPDELEGLEGKACKKARKKAQDKARKKARKKNWQRKKAEDKQEEDDAIAAGVALPENPCASAVDVGGSGTGNEKGSDSFVKAKECSELGVLGSKGQSKAALRRTRLAREERDKAERAERDKAERDSAATQPLWKVHREWAGTPACVADCETCNEIQRFVEDTSRQRMELPEASQKCTKKVRRRMACKIMHIIARSQSFALPMVWTYNVVVQQLTKIGAETCEMLLSIFRDQLRRLSDHIPARGTARGQVHTTLRLVLRSVVYLARELHARDDHNGGGGGDTVGAAAAVLIDIMLRCPPGACYTTLCAVEAVCKSGGCQYAPLVAGSMLGPFVKLLARAPCDDIAPINDLIAVWQTWRPSPCPDLERLRLLSRSAAVLTELQEHACLDKINYIVHRAHEQRDDDAAVGALVQLLMAHIDSQQGHMLYCAQIDSKLTRAAVNLFHVVGALCRDVAGRYVTAAREQGVGAALDAVLERIGDCAEAAALRELAALLETRDVPGAVLLQPVDGGSVSVAAELPDVSRTFDSSAVQLPEFPSPVCDLANQAKAFLQQLSEAGGAAGGGEAGPCEADCETLGCKRDRPWPQLDDSATGQEGGGARQRQRRWRCHLNKAAAVAAEDDAVAGDYDSDDADEVLKQKEGGDYSWCRACKLLLTFDTTSALAQLHINGEAHKNHLAANRARRNAAAAKAQVEKETAEAAAVAKAQAEKEAAEAATAAKAQAEKEAAEAAVAAKEQAEKEAAEAAATAKAQAEKERTREEERNREAAQQLIEQLRKDNGLLRQQLEKDVFDVDTGTTVRAVIPSPVRAAVAGARVCASGSAAAASSSAAAASSAAVRSSGLQLLESQNVALRKIKQECGAAEQQREVARDRLECVICNEIERSTAFMPCGHVVSCSGCAAQLDTCPVCRAAIEQKLQLRIS
jgi:flagellar biosynthesis GTPase FlhF